MTDTSPRSTPNSKAGRRAKAVCVRRASGQGLLGKQGPAAVVASPSGLL